MIIEFLSNICQKIKFPLKSDKNNGYFTWRRLYIYYNMSVNYSENETFRKHVVEKVKTHFMFHNFFHKIVPFMRQYGKNMVEPDTPQITWRMRFACRVTNSECVILTAFPQQQWLRYCASMLRYTYIASLVSISFVVQGSRSRWSCAWGTAIRSRCHPSCAPRTRVLRLWYARVTTTRAHRDGTTQTSSLAPSPAVWGSRPARWTAFMKWREAAPTRSSCPTTCAHSHLPSTVSTATFWTAPSAGTPQSGPRCILGSSDWLSSTRGFSCFYSVCEVDETQHLIHFIVLSHFMIHCHPSTSNYM